jgi:proline-specific peptidase
MGAIAATGRRVIFYDQLGAGNSDHPDDPSMWTIGLFLEELEVIRKALQLEQVHILGQSWGGMLAMEHALTLPPGLISLIISNSPASMPQWITETNRLLDELPPEIQKTIREHELAGTTDDPAYEEAIMLFYHHHCCRLDPWPECLNQTYEKTMQSPQVYQTMLGSGEFILTGPLKDWDIVNRLGEIQVPSLVLGGRYDEATPSITQTVHQGIPGSEWVIFEESSHMPHLEEPERYREVVSNFLDRVEAKISFV